MKTAPAKAAPRRGTPGAPRRRSRQRGRAMSPPPPQSRAEPDQPPRGEEEHANQTDVDRVHEPSFRRSQEYAIRSQNGVRRGARRIRNASGFGGGGQGEFPGRLPVNSAR